MNQKELKELIEFLIEKDIAEFELERGDVKVRVKRGTLVSSNQATHSVVPHSVILTPAAPVPEAGPGLSGKPPASMEVRTST